MPLTETQFREKLLTDLGNIRDMLHRQVLIMEQQLAGRVHKNFDSQARLDRIKRQNENSENE